MTTATVETSARITHPVHYGTVRIDDLDIFYRDAGPKTAPVILLLHGFPTSSNMFRNLIPRLAGSFRLVAPDYPGYGQSSAPDHTKFAYGFKNFANIMDKLMEELGIQKFLYLRHGLWSSRWLPARSSSSRANRGNDRAKWQCL